MKRRFVAGLSSALAAALLLLALAGCDEIVEEAVNAAGQAALDEVTRVAEEELGVPVGEIVQIAQDIENLGEYEGEESEGAGDEGEGEEND